MILKPHQRPGTTVGFFSPMEQKSSVMSRAAEQRRRCQSMKSYPSSELRNVCDEHNSAVEPAEEGVDLLQQMLDRR